MPGKPYNPGTQGIRRAIKKASPNARKGLNTAYAAKKRATYRKMGAPSISTSPDQNFKMLKR